MEVRAVAVHAPMSVYMVTVRLLLVLPHYPRFVRAFFIARMGFAHMRIHSQDGGCGDHARIRPVTRR